ncbi:MAG: HAMP domain-containing sensor histidine kinase, partial [Candidatus Omnitrophica bacterium]|nr:HAMP domain-containing sensor histidine kinase [Candidatus Omnitrophota bacterium]
SHELRTSMVSVEKSISMILAEKKVQASEAERQLLSIAERNLKRLTILINDILDFSKLEAGKMEFKKEASSIENIISEIVESLNTWAGTKTIELEKNIAGDLPEVAVDPMRLGQVLTNLIGNAIKFTPAGGKITVEAVVRKEDKVIEVSVQDTGVGIAEKDLSRVFDKFYQTGERNPSDISGTGLGLSIAKEIIQLHGGKIWAESKQGQGARFVFTIPLS